MRERAKVFILAGVAGGVAGFVGAAFHYLLDRANGARAAFPEVLAHGPVPGWLILMAAAAAMVILALWLVQRFAPEASGSGVQEVEGALAGVQGELRWWVVLPVKFGGGLLAIGAGLVLGREGPTIHMGGALGKMLGDWGRLDRNNIKTLIAAGAGAGLAAAFNAPLAGIMLVTEEMREEFDYTFVSLQSVILACCVSVVVNDWWLGQGPSLPVLDVPLAPLPELPLFLLLGVLVGAFGVFFNKLLLASVRLFAPVRKQHLLLEGICVGGAIGALFWFLPNTVGGGESLVERLVSQPWTLVALIALFASRTLTTAASYGSGVPGGIFAPMLALGTTAGVAFGLLVRAVFPAAVTTPGMYAVAGMGSLFAATVRAPLTGIVLVLELTGAQKAGLTVILTCLAATFTAEALGGRPIYRLLLENSLRKSGVAPRRI